MVSDTPSSQNEKKNVETAEDAAPVSPATSEPASLEPKPDETAVETAMADVAAAIKRHEDHLDEETLAQEQRHAEEDDGHEAADAEPVREKETPAQSVHPAPPPPHTPAVERTRGPGFAAMLAAGVAGAVIALAAAYALQQAGVIGSGGKTSDEIAALRQEIDTLKANDGTSKLQSDIDALRQQMAAATGSAEEIDTLKQQVGALQAGLQSDSNAVQSLQSGLDAVKTTLATGQQDVQNRIATIEDKLNTPGKDVAVARAISAAALKSAIDRGESFASELSTYLGVAPENAKIGALKTFADTGVPTQEELADMFSKDADAIIAASAPPPPEGNIFNRLVDSAKGLVSVRPVGDVEGDTVPDIVARIENALTEGDLKKAESEWETLPAASKQESQTFADGLKARIEADDLVSETLTEALGATAGASASGN
ncbi:COG4223 family protein [Martelella limonii]|uniref:COG4223 family protein n=1 Tax=Martelella limonii TaxID=1647649 RepID=UPI00158104C4|nr:hypothetical protein [Martelella limonii]